MAIQNQEIKKPSLLTFGFVVLLVVGLLALVAAAQTRTELRKKAADFTNQVMETPTKIHYAATPTCVPRPACLDARPACKIAELSSYCPRPTCIPRPACLDAQPACKIAESSNYCPPTPRPTPRCIPRPACLKGQPGCRIAEMPNANYCPPAPTCIPRPACLTAQHPCKIDELAWGNYCPSATPMPTVEITPTPIATVSGIIPYPSWWGTLPPNLQNFLEQLYLSIFYFNRGSNLQYLLQGVFPTPTPIP